MKFIILMTFFLGLNVKAQDYPKSDHFDGEVFMNPKGNHINSFLEVIKWKWTGSPAKWPENVNNKDFTLPILPENGKGIATFINHATFLLQFPGLTVITDPVYSERVSPVKFAGPKRSRLPGITFESLPKIDVVIISHNHYDHMDLATLKIIDAKFHPLFLVPLGNEKFLKSEGLQNVKEMDWWEEFKVRENKFVFAPSEHWSSRSLWDRNKTLWGSFMIVSPQAKVYFAGDTGYGEHFLDVKSRLGSPDLALLPIGAYEPRWFMKYHHMNPEDAVKAHKDLGASTSVGMHFGTFQLTDEGMDDPVHELVKARNKASLSAESFRVLEQGDSYPLP